MAKKEINLNYTSVERFLSDYAQLRRGKIFLPAKIPLPAETRVALQIFIPVIEEKVVVEGTVTKSLDDRAAKPLNKPSGMIVALTENPVTALQDLNLALSSYEDYRILLDLPPPNYASPKKAVPIKEPPAKNLESPEVQTSGNKTADAGMKAPIPASNKSKTTNSAPLISTISMNGAASLFSFIFFPNAVTSRMAS